MFFCLIVELILFLCQNLKIKKFNETTTKCLFVHNNKLYKTHFKFYRSLSVQSVKFNNNK